MINSLTYVIYLETFSLRYLKKSLIKQNFADRIQNYRNRLTHGEISYSDIGNEDLYRACKDMQLILQLSIINNMGFTKNNIKRFYYLDKIHSS